MIRGGSQSINLAHCEEETKQTEGVFTSSLYAEASKPDFRFSRDKSPPKVGQIVRQSDLEFLGRLETFKEEEHKTEDASLGDINLAMMAPSQDSGSLLRFNRSNIEAQEQPRTSGSFIPSTNRIARFSASRPVSSSIVHPQARPA